jgi:hypothetical protein
VHELLGGWFALLVEVAERRHARSPSAQRTSPGPTCAHLLVVGAGVDREDPGDLELPFDPAAVWWSWVDDLRTLVSPGGHFPPEAQPTDLADAIAKHLTR